MEKTLEKIITKAIRSWNKKQTFEPVEQAILAIRTLLQAKMPAKQQTQATHTGAWYETEWDEGYNKALTEMQKVIDTL